VATGRRLNQVATKLEREGEPMREESYADRLRLIGMLTEPAVREAIAALGVARGTTGLDVGCGAGDKTLWFAEEIGSRGCVIGVDTNHDHLAVARASADAAGLSGRFRFQPGDLHHLPFEDASFDWGWSADTLWPMPGIDPLAGVAEMRRVVKPGGFVGLLFWSNQSLLPGYPLLEAQLDLAYARACPRSAGSARRASPISVPERARRITRARSPAPSATRWSSVCACSGGIWRRVCLKRTGSCSGD
jgi:ubiquinone/menaquinone biosynthesis C-methylase UbiE